MKPLDDIFIECQTDKSSQTHGYAQHYEKYFEALRDKEIKLLEIGIGSGGSLNAWRKYFSKANIFGMDINPDCDTDGTFIGNATDGNFLNTVIAYIGQPDIIIDDSGHVGHETITTFKLLFDKVKSGGYYIIEDTSVWFNTHYSGEFQSNGRTEVYNFFSDLAYHVEVAGRGCCGNQDFAINHPTTEPPVPEYSRLLKAIHIYTGLWLFERK